MTRKTVAENSEIAELHNGVRPYETKDASAVKMLVGQGVMEGLARANKQTYTHPLSIAIWLAVSLILNYLLGFTPNPFTRLSYLAPLIGFGLSALPALAVVEYLHRAPFTAKMRATLGAADMVLPQRYYDPRAGSGHLLVLEHEGDIVGAIAIDLSIRAGQQLDSVLGEEEGQQGPNVSALQSLNQLKGKAVHGDVIQIRHLDVDIPFRKAGVAKELLLAGLDLAFESSSTADEAIVLTSPFTPGGNRLWRSLGFKRIEGRSDWAPPATMGLLGWSEEWWAISRERWSESRKAIIG